MVLCKVVFANPSSGTLLCPYCAKNILSPSINSANCSNCGLAIFLNQSFYGLIDYVFHVEELHREQCQVEPYCRIFLQKYLMLCCAKCPFYDTIGIISSLPTNY